VAGLMLLDGAANAATTNAVANDTGKAWQVLYHKGNPNTTHGAMAVRLRIKEGAGNKLTGTLTLYKSKSGGKYSGKLDITFTDGNILNNSGAGNDRKRQDFELLNGDYTDSFGTHKVTVKGFHYTGRNKAASAVGRTDDQLIIRIIDKIDPPPPAPANAPTKAVPTVGPCDDSPPDEDVLTEEDVAETTPPDPDYDAETP